MLVRLFFVFLFLLSLLLFMPVMAPFLAFTLSLMAAGALIRLAAESSRPARFRGVDARTSHRPASPWQQAWTWGYPSREEVSQPPSEPLRAPRRILAEALTILPPPGGFFVPALLGLVGLGLVTALPTGPALWMAALGVLFTSKWVSVAVRQAPAGMADLVERFRQRAYRRDKHPFSLGPWAVVGAVAAAGFVLLGRAQDETRAILTGMVTLITCLHTLRASGWPRPAGTQERSMEKAVEEAFMQIAQEHDGTFTATDVALATDLTLPQAGELLDTLHTQGLVTMEVQEDGVILYSFPELVFRQQGEDRLTHPFGFEQMDEELNRPTHR